MSSSTAQPPANDPAAKGTNKKKPIGSWFMKKFGRRPSVAEGCYDADGQGGTANGTAGTGTGSTTGTRRGSKTGGGCGGGGTTRSKRGDSQQQTLSPLEREGSFGGHSGEGLANTLMLPNTSSVVPSSPPQIEGLPVHDPIAPIELSTGPPLNAAATTTTTPGTGALGPAQGVVTANGQQSTLPSTTTPAPTSNPAQIAASTDTSAAALGGEAGPLPSSAIPVGERVVTGAGATGPTIVSASDADALSPSCDPQGRARSASSDSSSPSRSRSGTSFDMDSEQGYDGRERDSLGNRTMDTGKSRASTKPTTLMSLDTREQGAPQGPAPPMAHIAQFRHGDPLATSSPRVASLRDTASGRGEAAVQFVAPPLGRSASGTIVALPGQAAPPEEMAPYVNVPSHSRHHPSNNPAPSAIPPDNASLLTLASSTAAHSLGGAASSRGHGHQYTSSLGGARSIGGSLMGERRNSSDTYASVKALPPLSRRGSDSSSRTGRESVAASATGQNSAQAMLAGAGAGAGAGVAAVAAPGAPADRISMHRTPSVRTVATQLSIPLSASASNPALNAYAGPPAGAAAAVPGSSLQSPSPSQPTSLNAGTGSALGAGGVAGVGGVGTSPLAVSGHVDADADGERDADGEDGEENEVLATDLAVPLITQSAPDTSGPSESAAIAARANASTSSSLTGTGTGTGTDPIAAHAAALAATSSNSSGTDPISTHANALASAPAPSFANDTYSAASTSDEQTSSRPAAPHHSESDHVPGGFPGTHLTGTPYDAFPPGQGGEGEGRLGRT